MAHISIQDNSLRTPLHLVLCPEAAFLPPQRSFFFFFLSLLVFFSLIPPPKNKRDELVKLLIQRGANVNTKDVRGNTPLHFACTKKIEHIVSFMVKKGGIANVVNDEGDTPLHVAAKVGEVCVFYLFIY